MRCIAHRGFAEVNPENTVTAVEAAAERADAVEVDVRRCGSGELVVVHDETVDRVTDGSGPVSDLVLSTLADLDVLDSGDGIPAFEDVLAVVPDDVELLVDLKDTDLAADALDAADDAGVDLVVSSFSRAVLRETDDVADVPLAYIVREGDEAAIEFARGLGCAAIHPHWQSCVDEFVDAAHDRDLAVNAWTVPSRHDAEALEFVGVDGLIVDRPAVCIE